MAIYRKRFEPRWSDIDMNRHMRNTAYTEYAIDLRVSFLREHGFPIDELGRSGLGPVLVREEIRYLREIRTGEAFEVDFRVAGLSHDGSRWRIEHRFERGDGTRAALLRIEGVWLDLATRRPAPPPPGLLEAFRRADRTDDFEELVTRR
jgi:acyl-CoA thioester hydrolase